MKESGFWTTLPGILTGIAALITAITGLTLGLYQYGVLGSKQGEVAKPGTSATPSETKSTGPGPQVRVPGSAPQSSDPVSRPARQGAGKATVVITASDGTTTTLFADNFRQTAQYDAQLHLLSGQAIAFDRIRSIEVVKLYSDRADVRIALGDDKVIEASLGAGSSIFGFGGENELGTFAITVDRLKRIVFQR